MLYSQVCDVLILIMTMYRNLNYLTLISYSDQPSNTLSTYTNQATTTPQRCYDSLTQKLIIQVNAEHTLSIDCEIFMLKIIYITKFCVVHTAIARYNLPITSHNISETVKEVH